MSKAAEQIEEQEENHGLGDFISEFEQEEAERERQESQPDASEVQRAEALAAKMNSGFMWLVNNTQCPHVDLKEITDPKTGDAAFYGLAEKWGGEVPPWMEALQPYIDAGVYMGITIATARRAEAMVIEQARKAHAEQQAGTAHGDQ